MAVMRELIGEREITAQEAALDALGLPLIRYSAAVQYIQARPPEETILVRRRRGDHDNNDNNDCKETKRARRTKTRY